MIKHQLYFSLLLSIVFAIPSNAQVSKNISPEEYDLLKAKGKLDTEVNYNFSVTNEISHNQKNISTIFHTDSVVTTQCGCLTPLDNTFSLAAFVGYSAANGYRNDDASTNAIALPFNFNFYGTNYNSVFINNNGSISFGSGYSTFSASGFPSTQFQMIAPFWADVDTRDSASGLVYYKITSDYLIVKWENVGYYSNHTDKLNTFQVTISNGIDSLIGGGNNVAFCYGDMQWTTGDASNGTNGFGGTPATVGANKGNGTSFFQLMRTDASGTIYNNPYSNSSGVDYLDNKSFYFNVGSFANLPAIAYDEYCDTIFLNYNLFAYDVNINALEQNDSAFLSVVSIPDGMSLQIDTIGATLRVVAVFNPVNPGLQTLRLNYWDNYDPNRIGDYVQNFYVQPSGTVALQNITSKNEFKIYPNPTQNSLNLSFLSKNELKTIKIIDILGKTTIIQNPSEMIDISLLPNGMYFIEATDKTENKYLEKFIKD